MRRTRGSEAGYTLTQLRNLSIAPDWWQGDHPVPPTSVSAGKQGLHACANSTPMLDVVKSLSVAVMTDIVAYLASLPR